MATRSKSTKKDFESFEYVLNVFLELKAEVNLERAGPLKSYLFSQKGRNAALSSVVGFRLNGHLVLIEKENAGLLRRLIFFNPGKGTFRIKDI